jgi:DNA-binding MarR family transcriptional regulator
MITDGADCEGADRWMVKCLDDMSTDTSSDGVTSGPADQRPLGPPLIGALLRRPWEAVQRRMLERLHQSGFDDLDAAHLRVLQYPGPQGMRPSELAVRLRISKQALNYLLGQLESLGYVERLPDPEDLRSKRIALTPRGVSAGQAMRAAVAEMETEWKARLGAARFSQLRDLLLELDEPA